MNFSKWIKSVAVMLAFAAAGITGCRTHMPHSLTWPQTGDVVVTHPKPPEGGYYTNWDPYAVSLELTPLEDVNPVMTQHIVVATVRDKNGKALPNRRVEWIISEGSVGDIVEVDESGWRGSRGYKVDNHFAVSHTNNFAHVLDRGNSDPSDDIRLTEGQTWCVITSPVEGETYITAYAPGIYDWSKHKVFAKKLWYDVTWQFPKPASNPTGTTHEFVTRVTKYSDGSPLAGYIVTYDILDGPAGALEPGGGKTATVLTDSDGNAKVTLRQSSPAEGTNNVSIDIMRPENVQCCKPAVHIANGRTSKTWIPPKITIEKTCTPSAMVGDAVTYNIVVTNPSTVDANNVSVTDSIPSGISYVSSTPSGSASGQSVTWSLGSVKGGGSSSITVQAKATQVGKFENCADVRADQNLSGKACCTTVVTAPSLAVEKKCPAEVTVCDTIEYVITVRNKGDGAATNVKITDNLPTGLQTTDGKTSVTSTVGDLGPGQSKEARFMVKASAPGKYDNRVNASADGGLTAEANCSTVVRKPVLAVTKSGPNVRFIGRPAQYDITVSNTGDTVARNTMLVDPIPSGTVFVSATDGGRNEGGRVTWTMGNLEPGASKKVSLTVTANSAGSTKNTATATAVCAEASASTDMKIEGIPAILLEVVDSPDPIEVGGQTTYEIAVTNQGSAMGTNIVIEATLPAEEDYVSSTGPTQATAAGKTIRFAPLATLEPKARTIYKVVVTGNKAGDVRFAVSLKSDQMTTTANETESTRFYE